MRRLLMLSALLAVCANARALTPAQLTPQEKAAYDKISSDPDAAKHYLVTREYLRTCRKVLANPKSAASLPDIPDDYDGKYVTSGEQKQVDDALDLSFAALANAPIRV